jgi:hypothetical protein
MGSSAIDTVLAERARRVKRILESKDPAAIQIMDSGIEAAEILLERVVRKLLQPPLIRIVKGEGRRGPVDELVWKKGPNQRRLEAGEKTVHKGGKPFRNSGMTHETREK